MSSLRERFTANAEEFDSLMMEMLEENARMSAELDMISALRWKVCACYKGEPMTYGPRTHVAQQIHEEKYRGVGE